MRLAWGKRISFKSYPKKINLGCGYDKRKGYFNVDMNAFHKPDLVADVMNLSMLPDGYYQEAVAQDVLEHLGRTKTMVALKEWARILKMGGLLTIRVPNLLGLMDKLSLQNGANVGMQKDLVQCLYGTQAYDGDFHQTGFTKLLLAGYLEECGFGVVSMRSVDGWMMEVLAKKGKNGRGGGLDLADDWLFLEGWYEMEKRREGGFRWGTKRAYINVGVGAKKEIGFEIFTNYPGVKKRPVGVKVVDVASGEVLANVELRNLANKKVFVRCRGERQILELFTETTWVPRHWLGEDDNRELGIGITNIYWK